MTFKPPARVQLWLLRAALAGCSALPLPSSRAVGRRFGAGIAGSARRAAVVTRRNLALAFPDLDADQRQALTHASLAHAGTLVAEMGLTLCAAVPEVLSHVHAVAGDDTLDGDEGRLILGCHLGNWELLNLWLGHRFTGNAGRFLALFDPTGPADVVTWVRQRRERSGARVLPLNQVGLRAALAALRAGGSVGLLVDQVPSRRGGVDAPFFAHPALTMTLAQQLLRRTGAKAVFAKALRQPAGFDLSFRQVEGLDNADAVAAATALNAAVEQDIGSALEQYLWSYKRYKRPPGDRDDPYL